MESRLHAVERSVRPSAARQPRLSPLEAKTRFTGGAGRVQALSVKSSTSQSSMRSDIGAGWARKLCDEMRQLHGAQLRGAPREPCTVFK